MRRHSFISALVLLLTMASGLAACATAQMPAATPKPLDVPYVPTHEKVVSAMLDLAGVTQSDLLYDLGSGDGRIVIEAARRFGARGIGVEIDPERIREANENARHAGVTNRVRFIEGDIFHADFRDATVVTMYLLPDVNMKLRPKLQQLRPGTRIVSHNYSLGDWTPVKTIHLTVDGSSHTIFFWVVPPRLGG